MRALMLALVLFLTAALPAHAAVIWTEAEENGKTVTRWTRGANLNEAFAAVRAASGPDYRVLEVCRQPGFFAFVGSELQPQRGISCGYDTQEAALYAARLACELEDGRCDLERVGEDNGATLLGQVGSYLPTDMPGSTGSSGQIRPPTGPLAIQ